jgi:hypothetical protein
MTGQVMNGGVKTLLSWSEWTVGFLAARSCNPSGVGYSGRRADPGCTARPRDVECNPCGVKEPIEQGYTLRTR